MRREFGGLLKDVFDMLQGLGGCWSDRDCDSYQLTDEDLNHNKNKMFQGKTMIGQNVLLELNIGDVVQVYAYTSTGITDHKNSRYTQVCQSQRGKATVAEIKSSFRQE